MPADKVSAGEIGTMEDALEAAEASGLVRRLEPAAYMLFRFAGTGDPVPTSWNVAVYAASRKDPGWHSVVCVDPAVLEVILDGDLEALRPSDRPAVVIDDAGWGFPLLGAMVGVETGGRVEVDAVPAAFFRNPAPRDAYLVEYARRGLGLLARVGAAKATHRIEICTGWINTELLRRLRDDGWEAKVVVVAGLLQDTLEEIFRRYALTELGEDLYYDPKVLTPGQIAAAYRKAVDFGRRKRPDLLKTHWKALG
jgi:hypothetical protein